MNEERQANIRRSMLLVAGALTELAALLPSVPSPSPFVLYSRSHFDGPLLERALDRTHQLLDWLTNWTGSSLTSLPAQLQNSIHVQVLSTRGAAEQAHALLVEAAAAHSPVLHAEARLVLLRVFLADLIDERGRLAHSSPDSLRAEIARVLAATA